MDEVEMDLSEPSGESPRTFGNVTFKPPKTVNRNKLHPYTMYESSGYISASSPEMNSTTGSLPCSTRMTRRLSNDSQMSVSPECSFRANMLRSIEASPDSGFDSESVCGSVGSKTDSIVLDVDVDMSVPPVSGMKRPAAPEVPGSAHSCRLEVNFSEIGPHLQSTPVYAGSKPSCVTFADSCVFQLSPSKRRRPSTKKASRDLFQSRQKGTLPSFSLDSPSTSSAELPSLAGRESVDFLFYLGKRSVHQPVLDLILGHLSPADLCRASLVCKSWKSIIENIPSVARKKQDYVDSCMEVKENVTQSTKKTGAALPFRGQLIEVQNYNHPEEIILPEPRSPPVSPSKVRFNLFLKEGRKLEDGQTLVQCPQCKLPARKEAEPAARCTRRGCQFYFCVLCLCKFHGEKVCPVSAVKHRKRQVAIGSRESRRNLLRLCK
ncbi:F-box only protein 43-like [Thrips palmi]|uniref:F-box only protein 43-like n=1 Tax=Thrips palmi TaxID=161013 RepID=A0A6P9A574_THRPL|nr:F-box only protein 43-like [Thrips palmi]